MHLFTSLLIIFEGFSILIISYTVTLSQDLLHTRKLSEMWSFCLLKVFAVHLPSTSRQKRYVSKKKRKKKKRKQKKRKKNSTKRLESSNSVISALWPVPAHAQSYITVDNLVSRASVTFVQRRIATSGNEIGAVKAIPHIAEILLLCRPVSSLQLIAIAV